MKDKKGVGFLIKIKVGKMLRKISVKKLIVFLKLLGPE